MTVGEIIAIIVGVIGFAASLCAVLSFILTRKKEHYENGKDDGSLRGDIKYMRNGFDDIRLDIKEISRKQDSQNERLTRVEESCKQAHKRIDSLESRSGFPHSN